MNNELFALSLKTFDTIWGDTKTCDNSDNTFEIVRLGNTMRNRIYRLINKKLISNNCFSDNDCSLDEEVECNIFDFVSKNSNSLNLQAYLEYVNNTIFRVVNSFDNTRIFGPEYKIFSPDNTPLLYEHQCLTDESILIKNVHKTVLEGQDVSMRTLKTGKCGIFRIEYMSNKLKQMVQKVIPDLVNNATSSISDFFFSNTTEQTSLNYTNNYGMMANSTNSTDINSYDVQNTNDHTMLVHLGILASAVTATASVTYLLTHMYNKYCKAPIAQTETADANISDPNLMEINRKTVKIYHSDSSSDGKDYAIIDISSKKAKYTKATYDSSNPSTSDSYIYETIDNITDQGYITDSYTQDKVNLKTYSRVALNQEGNQHIRIQLNSQPYINKGNENPIYDNCRPEYDYLPLHPRPVTVIENKNFHVPVEQYHDDLILLGLSEFPC